MATVLDRINQYAHFDPRQHYQLTLMDSELTEVERNARRADDVDEIELHVDCGTRVELGWGLR